MKKRLLMTVIFLSAFSLAAYAQQEGKGKSMGGHGKEMMHQYTGGEAHGHMMKGQEMHEKMSPCMNKMHIMMKKMNTMMDKEMTSENRQQLADAMKSMSKNMMDMSNMMKKGYCTLEEMEALDKDVSETEKRFDALEDYL